MVADESREQDASEWSWLHSPAKLSRRGATVAVHVGECSQVDVSSAVSLGEMAVARVLGMPVRAHKSA